jgi:hypothetical protein
MAWGQPPLLRSLHCRDCRPENQKRCKACASSPVHTKDTIPQLRERLGKLATALAARSDLPHTGTLQLLMLLWAPKRAPAAKVVPVNPRLHLLPTQPKGAFTVHASRTPHRGSAQPPPYQPTSTDAPLNFAVRRHSAASLHRITGTPELAFHNLTLPLGSASKLMLAPIQAKARLSCTASLHIMEIRPPGGGLLVMLPA